MQISKNYFVLQKAIDILLDGQMNTVPALLRVTPVDQCICGISPSAHFIN